MSQQPDATRFRRTLITVMTVQAISLLLLWVLQVVYTA
jgi:hypothetical protein